MSAGAGIAEGTEVYGADQELVGTVVAVHYETAVPIYEIDCPGGACRVPLTAIERVEQGRVYLPHPAAQYRSQPHARAARAAEPGSAEAEEV
jgi:hypothetical protein